MMENILVCMLLMYVCSGHYVEHSVALFISFNLHSDPMR